jgi:hypothetical protein
MFNDFSWLGDRSERQQQNFNDFLQVRRHAPLAVIEMGAGSAIPTIRYTSERLGGRQGVTVIRINPREAQIDPPHISLPCGAREGLTAIDDLL